MRDLADETDSDSLRLGFDRRLKLEFHRSQIISDAGFLACCDLDDALSVNDMCVCLARV